MKEKHEAIRHYERIRDAFVTDKLKVFPNTQTGIDEEC